MDYVIIMLPLGSGSLESKVQFTGIPIQSYLQWLYAEICLTSMILHVHVHVRLLLHATDVYPTCIF